jgi:SAM-dependent methyltransferase
MTRIDASTARYQSEYSPEFAASFDEIVGWNSRGEHERGRLVELLRSHRARRVLDAACGTGFHLHLLAQEGFDLVGTDGAEAMVNQAQANLTSRGIAVPLHVCDWRELTQCQLQTFDAILCLGDSFAHLLNPQHQLDALRQFFDLLAPGGILILDHRNYDRVVDEGSYIERPSGYCCCGDAPPRQLRIDADGLVTSQYRNGDGVEFVLRTFPISTADIAISLTEAGFDSVQTLNAGSGSCCGPQPGQSDFIVEIATKASRREPIGA